MSTSTEGVESAGIGLNVSFHSQGKLMVTVCMSAAIVTVESKGKLLV